MLRKPMAVVALLLAAFFLLQTLLPLRTTVQIGSDEGFELAKATLCLKGHQLYSEVWNDQPPLHTFLVTQVLKHVSPSIFGPRLMTSAFTAMLLCALFFIVLRCGGILVATLTTAFLVVSPGFLELSSSCMLEIPSLSTAVAALCVLLLIGPTQWRAGELLAGILFGTALEMKLVPAIYLTLAALIICLPGITKPK
jgi:dolichyl-phosphate-mannose--protein O-mannosyl transferase